VVEYIGAHPGTSLTVDNFWVRYVTASGHWCSTDGCLITPTWNHMWFVAYLLFYTLVLAGLLLVWKRLGEHIQAGAERLLKGPWLIAAPILFLGLLRATLYVRYGETHALVGDHYVHAVSFSAFLLGFRPGQVRGVAPTPDRRALAGPGAGDRGLCGLGELSSGSIAATRRSRRRS
jgi:glucan biosynthesis protein C